MKANNQQPAECSAFATQGDRYRYALEVIARSGNKTMANVAVEALSDGQHLPLTKQPAETTQGEGLTAQDVFDAYKGASWDEQEEVGPFRGRNKGWAGMAARLNSVLAARAADASKERL